MSYSFEFYHLSWKRVRHCSCVGTPAASSPALSLGLLMEKKSGKRQTCYKPREQSARFTSGQELFVTQDCFPFDTLRFLVRFKSPKEDSIAHTHLKNTLFCAEPNVSIVSGPHSNRNAALAQHLCRLCRFEETRKRRAFLEKEAVAAATVVLLLARSLIARPSRTLARRGEVNKKINTVLPEVVGRSPEREMG